MMTWLLHLLRCLTIIRPCFALDFLDCSGEHFEPRWSSFQALLPASVTPETPLSEAQLNEAADLVDTLEEVDWAEVVSAFSSRLRGELTTEQLGGFCLFGAVTAYTVVAYHLARGAGDDPIPSTAKNLLARSLMILAKKQVNDFLESSWWPVRSLDVVALLELEDFQQVRNLRFEMPCWLRLGCSRPDMEERALLPPAPPLEASWPSNVVAVGLHTTSTLEVVTALRDAITESWGRGGAGGAPFNIQYAGHPCPSHSGSEHHCAMRCELLGICSAAEDAADALAEFVAGAVDVAKFEERESYAMDEARAALRWAPRRLEPVRQAELIVCTFPTVLCVLLHEFFPETPQLYVAIANPLFAAPGCTKQEDSTVRHCETAEAQEFLLAFRSMLSDGVVRGVAAYTVTTALVAYQAGVVLPLAGG
ncbi:unnamed protein product [Durusdinium trenchii]|uniref:Uncharacterized protein n=1 Tax=Durusdinium trenchii TaxID=1381693 RepID=A0ABP0RFE1_9DINO